MGLKSPIGPVDAAGAAYREAKTDAFYSGTIRLRWTRRRLARRSDDVSKARLRAVVEELVKREMPG